MLMIPRIMASTPQRAELEQQITGDEFNDYLVSAKAGEILNVTLTPSNLSNYFYQRQKKY